MCHKIALRERGKKDFVTKPEEYKSHQEAVNAAHEIVQNSGFDAFQIWKLENTYAETITFQPIPKYPNVTLGDLVGEHDKEVLFADNEQVPSIKAS